MNGNGSLLLAAIVHSAVIIGLSQGLHLVVYVYAAIITFSAISLSLLLVMLLSDVVELDIDRKIIHNQSTLIHLMVMSLNFITVYMLYEAGYYYISGFASFLFLINFMACLMNVFERNNK